MEKLLEIINEAEADEIDENGEYFEDKLLFGVLELDIDSDKYELKLYDETEAILVEECWTAYLQIFDVCKNGELIGYIGRENRMSCCGSDECGKFKEFKPKEITTITWERQ